MDKKTTLTTGGILIAILVVIVIVSSRQLSVLMKTNNALNKVNTIEAKKVKANNEVVKEDTTEYNITDNYTVTNRYYEKQYLNVMNNHIKNGKGYVSLNRVLYFYNANTNLSFDEIYEDNLTEDGLRSEKISVVCAKEKYSSLSICTEDNIANSGQIDLLQKKPFVKPLPINSALATSVFMEQRSYEIHPAWDIAAPTGTTISSVCDGTVLSVGRGYGGGYGNNVIVSCQIDDLTYNVLYAHMNYGSIAVVEGQTVTKNTTIGSVGCSGSCTGPHLHFEVTLNNAAVDGLSLVDFAV